MTFLSKSITSLSLSSTPRLRIAGTVYRAIAHSSVRRLESRFGNMSTSTSTTTTATTAATAKTSPMTTTAAFKFIDTSSYPSGTKPWGKVDGPGQSFTLRDHTRTVTSLRGQESLFSTENSGFAVYRSASALEAKDFADSDAGKTVKERYYPEVEALVREKLNGLGEGKVKKVVIFDHTIRRHDPSSPRQPVQQVHVDQTPGAAMARVRRHISDPAEAEELVNGRFAIINVWRPISHPASDFPLAVVDWRSTKVEDFIPVDLMYPLHPNALVAGNEVLPDEKTLQSLEGYEAKGETFAVAPSAEHRLYYQKDMGVDEVLFLKCYDSRGEGEGAGDGKKGRAVRTPHTAFVDPATPEGVKGRESIEVRCLVFYE